MSFATDLNYGSVNQGGRARALRQGKQSVSFSIAAGGSNISNVTISLTDQDGNVLPGIRPLWVLLSDSKVGKGLTTTSASGTVQAASSGGAVLGVGTAKKCILVQTLENGTFVLEITDSAKTTFYVAAYADMWSEPIVSRILATGDYG